MSGLQNKVVIVTGASGGIGGATAVEFARVGARLCITGRNEAKLNETKIKCVETGLLDDKILTVIADVTKPEDISKLIAKTVEKFQQMDVLVNNAGGVIFKGYQDTSEDDMDEMYYTNLKPVFALSKAALPHLLLTKGNVVNVSSFAGTRPLAGVFAYGAAKAAINHMTQMMALELGPKGIRVNCVNPGFIVTGIFTKPGGPMASTPERLPEYMESVASIQPMQRVGQAQEVAAAILFLASDSSSFISGAIVPVDGAWHTTFSTPSYQWNASY